MKKMILSLLCAVSALAASAQTYTNKPLLDRSPFGEGKFYVASSLSGLDLRFNDLSKWDLNVQAKAGYLFQDNWMVLAQAGYDWHQKADNTFSAGAGLRYYIEQNGLFVGMGANYVHRHNYDDLMPNVNLGYSFFLNRTVTIEPEIYYNQSLKNHGDYSGFGFRIGFGIYFE